LFFTKKIVSQLDSHFRNALKAYVFLVEWLISTEESLSRKVQSEKIPVVREKVGPPLLSDSPFFLSNQLNRRENVGKRNNTKKKLLLKQSQNSQYGNWSLRKKKCLQH
jgi:hypothetical protein